MISWRRKDHRKEERNIRWLFILSRIKTSKPLKQTNTFHNFSVSLQSKSRSCGSILDLLFFFRSTNEKGFEIWAASSRVFISPGNLWSVKLTKSSANFQTPTRNTKVFWSSLPEPSRPTSQCFNLFDRTLKTFVWFHVKKKKTSMFPPVFCLSSSSGWTVGNRSR